MSNSISKKTNSSRRIEAGTARSMTLSIYVISVGMTGYIIINGRERNIISRPTFLDSSYCKNIRLDVFTRPLSVLHCGDHSPSASVDMKHLYKHPNMKDHSFSSAVAKRVLDCVVSSTTTSTRLKMIVLLEPNIY